MMERAERLTGLLLGTAVGDAIGLPREGLGPSRAVKLFGGPPLTHKLLPGRGMTSDDTDHACLVGQSLLAANGDADRFGRALAWRLRFWFASLPAGIGFATLRACLKLWLGFPARLSGVSSAGNGPAMRAPLLGAMLGDTPQLEAFVALSTRATHRHPLADDGALLIALAAAEAVAREPGELDASALLHKLAARASTPEFRQAMKKLGEHHAANADPRTVAESLGLAKGVTGFILHTVPAALYCWLRAPADPRAAIESVVLLGGDADTTGAIVGALAGAHGGVRALPPEWLDGIVEWPRSLSWMKKLGGALAESAARPPRLFWPALLVRNLLQMPIVLAHGFRRMLPPY